MSTLIAAALVAVGGTWNLNAPVGKDAKFTLPMKVEVSINEMEHVAEFKMTTHVLEAHADHSKLKMSWTDIALDGAPADELPAWEFRVGPKGELFKAEGDLTEDYVRMAAPLMFIYPNKSVSAGDKWDHKAGKLTYSFTAMVEEKYKETPALKVQSTLKEEGNPIESEGTWWVDGAGKLLGFDLKVKNWVIPFTGDTQPLYAKIKGG